jgi:hypothetical protein
VFYSVILSGAKNLFFFVFLLLNRREILRSAQNDRNGEFSRSLFSRGVQALEDQGLWRLNSHKSLSEAMYEKWLRG